MALRREPDLHESVHALIEPDRADRWPVCTAWPEQRSLSLIAAEERVTRDEVTQVVTRRHPQPGATGLNNQEVAPGAATQHFRTGELSKLATR
jgi:hypothetical protein